MDYKSDKVNSDQNSQLSFRIFSYGNSIANLDKEGKEEIKQNLINEEKKEIYYIDLVETYIQLILMITYIYTILYIN